MLLGAAIGLKKTDLKQILAYATISVLGLLVMLIGLDTHEARPALVAYFIAHAFYKGALFLVAGAVDHETGTRDLSRLGTLWPAMPWTAAAGLLAALSMAGVPLFLGFTGKELVLKAVEHARYAPAFTAAAVAASALLFVLAAAAGFRPFFHRSAEPPEAHDPAPAMWMGPLLVALCGLAGGIFPSLLEAPIRSGAAAISQASPPEVHLAVFPGLELAFFLSLGALAAGTTVYLFYGRLQKAAWPAMPGLSALYDSAMDILERAAGWQTSRLQSGYLKHYLVVVMAGVLVLFSYPLVRSGGALKLAPIQPVLAHEALLAAAILIAVIAAMTAPSPLAATTALGVAGSAIALLFAFFGAPDLAMTQLIVETVTVIVLVLALYHLPGFKNVTPPGARARDLALAISAGTAMAAIVVVSAAVNVAPSISPYFIETARPLAHGRNVVNVILVDYRALDTTGEITVLAIAGAGVYALLRLRMDKREGH
jgi:multicomponent Na+:H+ antiporter subunit A